MLPTYQSGSLNLVNRLAYRNGKPSRGDIVAIRLAGPHVLYVKRIIALPGERISMTAGQVYVNGTPLIEPYVRNRNPWDVPEVTLTSRIEPGTVRTEVTLAPDQYFVVGDNRGMRASDHDFGRVDVSRIVGRIVF